MNVAYGAYDEPNTRLKGGGPPQHVDSSLLDRAGDGFVVERSVMTASTSKLQSTGKSTKTTRSGGSKYRAKTTGDAASPKKSKKKRPASNPRPRRTRRPMEDISSKSAPEAHTSRRRSRSSPKIPTKSGALSKSLAKAPPNQHQRTSVASIATTGTHPKLRRKRRPPSSSQHSQQLLHSSLPAMDVSIDPKVVSGRTRARVAAAAASANTRRTTPSTSKSPGRSPKRRPSAEPRTRRSPSRSLQPSPRPRSSQLSTSTSTQLKKPFSAPTVRPKQSWRPNSSMPASLSLHHHDEPPLATAAPASTSILHQQQLQQAHSRLKPTKVVKKPLAQAAGMAMAKKQQAAVEKQKWRNQWGHLSFSGQLTPPTPSQQRHQRSKGSDSHPQRSSSITNEQPRSASVTREKLRSSSNTSRPSATPSMQSLNQSSIDFLSTLAYLGSDGENDDDENDRKSIADAARKGQAALLDESLPYFEQANAYTADLSTFMDNEKEEEESTQSKQRSQSAPSLPSEEGEKASSQSKQRSKSDSVLPEVANRKPRAKPKRKWNRPSKEERKRETSKKGKEQTSEGHYATGEKPVKRPSKVEYHLEEDEDIFSTSCRSESTKPSLASVPVSPHFGSNPLAIQDREDSSRVSPQRRVTQVNVLSSFLDQYDDLDALFTQGLVEAAAVEEASKATEADVDVSETTDTSFATEGQTVSSKKQKRKSRASVVLKRFMKNFDELDFLFPIMSIKGNDDKGSKSSRSKDDMSIGDKSRSLSSHDASSRPSLSSPVYTPRSLPSVLEHGAFKVPTLEELGSGHDASPKSPQRRLPQPNPLKEMLDMSQDDLASLFSKDNTTETASFDFGSIKNKESVAAKDSATKASTASNKDELLSKISKEPSYMSMSELARRSLSSLDVDASKLSIEEDPKHQSATFYRSMSLTMEDLMSPELQDDTDHEDDPKKRYFTKSTSDVERRARSSADLRNELRKKAPPRRKVERSLSPSPRPTRVQSETTGVRADGSSDGLDRRSLPASLEHSAKALNSSKRSLPSPRPRPRQKLSPPRRTSQPDVAQASLGETPRGEHRGLPASLENNASELQSSQGRLHVSLSESHRSLSPRSRRRQRVQARNSPASPNSLKSEDSSGRRRLSSRQQKGNRSLSPQRRPIRRDSEPVVSSSSEHDGHSSGRSLPDRLELEDSPPQSPKRRLSQPEDIRQSLLDRRQDFEGLINSGLEDAVAPVMTDQLDIEYEAIEEMKAAKARARTKQRAEGDQSNRDNMLVKNVSRRAVLRTHSKKREAARAATANETAGQGAGGRALEAGGSRPGRERSPVGPRRLATEGISKGATAERDLSHSRPRRASTEETKDSNEVLEAAKAKKGPSAESQRSSAPHIPKKGKLRAKAKSAGRKSAVTRTEQPKVIAEAKSSVVSGGQRQVRQPSKELYTNRVDSDTQLNASYPVTRQHTGIDDGHMSLPTDIAAPGAGGHLWSPHGPDGFDSLDGSSRNNDDNRSAYAGRSIRESMGIPDAYTHAADRHSAAIGLERHRGGPYKIYDVYESHPNLAYGRRDRDTNDFDHTINEPLAHHYGQSHPILHYGRTQPNANNNPHPAHNEYAYSQASMRHYHPADQQGYTVGSFPRDDRHFQRRYRDARFEGGRSMSLEDVFDPNALSRTDHSRAHSRAHSHPPPAAVTAPPPQCEESSRSSSECRLSSSIHKQELEWDDFNEAARDGALQSIPWRNIRGLSYQQRLSQAAEARNVSSLKLDDTFHWRYHHAVSQGCTRSNNEFCCSKDCCCKIRCSPPLYHRPAQDVFYSEEKEEDTEPSYRGRSLQESLKGIQTSVHASATTAVGDEDDSSIVYPECDGKMDRRPSEETFLSFA